MKDNKKNIPPQKSAPKVADKTISSNKKSPFPKETFALGKMNFILMAIGLLFIIIGFIFMASDGDKYSFKKMNLSVIFVMLGFFFEIYAIMKKPK
jgi:hypothetical protein